MAASGSAPLAVCLCNDSHCANQQNPCLPRTIRCYQMPPRLHEGVGRSDYPTFEPQQGPAASRSVRKRHPPTGDPLEERPTDTSVTPQANTPNEMDHPVCRNFVDSPKRGFPVSSRPGRVDPIPDAARRGKSATAAAAVRRCGQALTAKLTANRSDSCRSVATSADEHEPSTCRDGRQRTTLDGRGRVRRPPLRPARRFRSAGTTGEGAGP
jgi:hypothetical protein